MIIEMNRGGKCGSVFSTEALLTLEKSKQESLSLPIHQHKIVLQEGKHVAFKNELNGVRDRTFQ